MKLTKKTIYVGLFAILYLIVAFSSFFHACAFFGLANNTWMSVILAFAFEVGQAAVLFSLLTSAKDRSRIMPWVLMTMFTLVQVIGNIYSSYKYIIINSVENLKYFKEPIFIWTSLPDDQATVIVVYLVGALLPIAALLLTSMMTNYLTDQSEEETKVVENTNVTIDKNDEEINQSEQENGQSVEEKQDTSNSNVGEQPMETIAGKTDAENSGSTNDGEGIENNETDKTDISTGLEENGSDISGSDDSSRSTPIEQPIKKPSHFINLTK